LRPVLRPNLPVGAQQASIVCTFELKAYGIFQIKKMESFAGAVPQRMSASYAMAQLNLAVAHDTFDVQ
jgi:hypothetical protein